MIVAAARTALWSGVAALSAAGCERIFADHASGRLAPRPELDKAVMVVRDDDELVVTKLDRLGRWLKHLIELSNDLQARGERRTVRAATHGARLRMGDVDDVADQPAPRRRSVAAR